MSDKNKRFRLWDINNKEYLHSNSQIQYFLTMGGNVIGASSIWLRTDFKDITDQVDVEFETGCIDKEKRKIYKNDKFTYEITGYGGGFDGLIKVIAKAEYNVEWGCWQATTISNTPDNMFNALPVRHWSKEIKVIGTIHDEIKGANDDNR